MIQDLQNRQKALAQAEEERAASLEQKTKELQARESRLAERERQADAHLADHHKSDEDIRKAQLQQEVDLQRKIDELEATEGKVAADRAALHKSKADFAAKEKDMQQGQKEFEDQRSAAEHDMMVARIALKQERGEFESQKASAANKVKTCTRRHASDDQGHSLNDTVIGKMKLDNVKLEQRLEKLEQKLALTSTLAATEMKEPFTNGHVKGSAANGVGVTGCGHKHYKPPR